MEDCEKGSAMQDLKGIDNEKLIDDFGFAYHDAIWCGGRKDILKSLKQEILARMAKGKEKTIEH